MGSIYTYSGVPAIDIDDISPFAAGSLILVILILILLIKFLPDKLSEKVVNSMPFVIIGAIILIVIIAVIFNLG
ncbi:hypothetical protein ACXZ7E_23120 [Paenibacillus lautus]